MEKIMTKIDEVKSYWDNRPCNVRHSKETPGTELFYNQVEAKKYFVEPHIPVFADFGKWNGKKVLEIGCGLGTETINFARSGAEVTVIELSTGSLDLAKMRAKIFGLQDKIKFFQGNAEELSTFINFEQFDLIWSFGVIHHSPNPEKIIQQIRSFMSPQTELRIMLYYKYSWKVFWILIKYGRGKFWKLKELVAQYSEAQLGCPVTHVYSKSDVKKLLKGFKIKEISIEHIFSWKFPEYKDNIYKKVWYFRWLPKKVFDWLEKRFGWHLCIRAVLQ